MADFPAQHFDPYNVAGNLYSQDSLEIVLFYWFDNPYSPSPGPPPNPPAPSPGVGDPGYQYEQLTPIVNAFLGYRPTSEELDGFPFDIYRFIIRSLRDRDQNKAIGGTRLLERFLLGPEEIWLNLYRAGSKLNTLFDPEEIESEYLNSLARLVGFGKDLIDIVGAATEEELRRIIAGAISFWKKRWLDNGIVAAIRLVTGNRFKVRDFFDFRFIVGETRIEEDLRNTDPNMISVKTRNFFRQGDDGISRFDSTPYSFHSPSQLPKTDDVGGYIVVFDDTGTPDLNGFYKIVGVDVNAEIWYVSTSDWFPRADSGLSWFIAFRNDENLTEIRIVDEKTGSGKVNRNLLEKLLLPQRPNSERFNVVYVDFMDLFQTPNDLGLWEPIDYPGMSLDVATVDGGRLTLYSTSSSGGALMTNRPTANWKNFQWKIKAALATTGAARFIFNYDDPDNFMQVAVSYVGFGTGRIVLSKTVSGTPSLITIVFHPSLNLETYWTYTIETYILPSGNLEVRVLVNGNVVIDLVTAVIATSGNIAIGVDTNTELWIEETELWQYPLDIVRLGPYP